MEHLAAWLTMLVLAIAVVLSFKWVKWLWRAIQKLRRM